MRVGTFKEMLPVALVKDEIDLLGRSVARQDIAIGRYEAETEGKADDWKREKKEREAKAEEMREAMRKNSVAVDTGVQERLVDCEEVLVGVMVHVRRVDTGETVGTPRPATKDELRGTDKQKPKGYTAEEKAAKLLAGIQKLTDKPKPEATVLKNLAAACPEATAEECKAALTRAIEEGKVAETPDGKCGWIAAVVTPPPAAKDDGVVPDDYDPRNPTH